MDTDYFPDIMRVLADLPEALEHLGDKDAADRLKRLAQSTLMGFLQQLRSERVPAADQLLSDAYELLNANYVDRCSGDTDSWLDFMQRELADISNQTATESTP